jgi:hypothetical protein
VCYNINVILRIFYLPLIGIFIAFLAIAILFILNLNTSLNTWCNGRSLVILCVFSLVICILTWLIFNNEKFYKNPLTIRKAMVGALDTMNNLYWDNKTVFRQGESIENFHIYIESME